MLRPFLLCVLLALVLQTIATAQTKPNQIGLRLGAPLGVTYRRNITERTALELVVGTGSRTWNARYYERSFESHFGDDATLYLDHSVSNIIHTQLRYLFLRPIVWEGVPGKFDWYFGPGVGFKSAKVKYVYETLYFPFGVESTTRTDVDFGPELVVGGGYTLEEIPLNFFLEVNILIELSDRPGQLRGNSAIGLRYGF
jgi:hypothetical protein